MAKRYNDDKRFLFLQGPHGPFFQQLGRMLSMAGAEAWRVGFNAGDQAFWRRKDRFIPFKGTPAEWPETFKTLIAEKKITDIVLYGDTRPIHAQAIEIAKSNGLTVHVFEEGYLRPYWITYERGGSNGHSDLMSMNVADMQATLEQAGVDIPEAPGHWGNLRQHMFYGALYHWFVMFRNGAYANFQTHRSISVSREFQLHLKRLLLMPWHAMDRVIATLRIKWGGFPYHLALLQLEHDSSFRDHSDFETMADFLEKVIEGFATSAPTHHHLVFKAHPLEDGRVPLRHDINRLAKQFNVEDRVHFVRGGKLAHLLDYAKTAITVNSTSAQQALWRGLPLKAFGTAVFAKPEFVSEQPLADFFQNPARPDTAAYRDYRLYLLETSQIPGGYYSARSRRQLLRQVVDLMLAPDDPYTSLQMGTAAPRQQLSLVK